MHVPSLTFSYSAGIVVSRPDRKDLLAYLSGETSNSTCIDKSAPIELPVPLTDVKSLAGDSSSEHAASAQTNQSSAEDGPSAAKMLKPNDLDIQKAKEKFSEQLDARGISARKQIASSASVAVAGASGSLNSSLAETLSIEKIAEIKAKRLQQKKNTIIDPESEMAKDGSDGTSIASGPSILHQFDSDRTREIQSRERIWRDRTTILQSTGKNFAKSIFPILNTIKVKEEGGPVNRKPASGSSLPLPPASSHSTPVTGALPGSRLTTPSLPAAAAQQQYNRYDQERFSRHDAAIGSGFRIDTTGTYHGLTLKSVTESTATPQPAAAVRPPIASLSPQIPAGQKKRTSKTPIIIIPATPTSIITMTNAKSILQDLKYADPDPNQRDSEVLIQRKKADGTFVPYRIIDNANKLAPADWDRVVAVFVQGPAWQFKGWPWQGNPVEIFSRIKAFHLKFDEAKLDANVAKWSVHVITLSRNKRHLDRANMLDFWAALDAFMMKQKPHLRF